MTETLFYHLERRGLDDVLPGLLEKTLERGWRAIIRTESAERAQALDNLLWAYNDQTFLPHAQRGDGDPARQPVLITVEEGNPSGAQILFVVGGAQPPGWDTEAAQGTRPHRADVRRTRPGSCPDGALGLEGRQRRGPRRDLLEGNRLRASGKSRVSL